MTISTTTTKQLNEKALRETQTLHAGCINVELKKFRPVPDHLPGGTGRPKFNQLKIVTTVTYTPSLVKIDVRNFELSAILSYHGNRPTQTMPVRPLQTHRQDQ